MSYPDAPDYLVAADYPARSRLWFKLRARDRNWWHGFVPSSASFQLSDTTPITPTWTQAGFVYLWVPSHRYGSSGIRINLHGKLSLAWTTNLTGSKVVQARLRYDNASPSIYSTMDTLTGGYPNPAVPSPLDIDLRIDIPVYAAEYMPLTVELLVSATTQTGGRTVTGTFAMGQSESGLRSYVCSLPR